MNNPIKIILPLLLFVLASCSLNAQIDLLNELEAEVGETIQYELPAFKAMQIGNVQSTKIADKGDLYLNVAHRFGYVNDGIDEFFGLDQANTRIQLTYGFADGLQLGVSRDSYKKTYSVSAKIRAFKQSTKMPVNVVGYLSVDLNTILKKSIYSELKFTDKLSYTTQVLVSRRISPNLSLQIAPTYVRNNLQNLNFTKAETFDQFLIGIGGRYKFTKRMSFNVDYAYNVSKDSRSLYHNPLTIGFDIETGGHVFQLLFSNARGSNDSAFLTKALGDWVKGDVSFGFNVVRVF